MLFRCCTLCCYVQMYTHSLFLPAARLNGWQYKRKTQKKRIYLLNLVWWIWWSTEKKTERIKKTYKKECTHEANEIERNFKDDVDKCVILERWKKRPKTRWLRLMVTYILMFPIFKQRTWHWGILGTGTILQREDMTILTFNRMGSIKSFDLPGKKRIKIKISKIREMMSYIKQFT